MKISQYKPLKHRTPQDTKPVALTLSPPRCTHYAEVCSRHPSDSVCVCPSLSPSLSLPLLLCLSTPPHLYMHFIFLYVHIRILCFQYKSEIYLNFMLVNHAVFSSLSLNISVRNVFMHFKKVFGEFGSKILYIFVIMINCTIKIAVSVLGSVYKWIGICAVMLNLTHLLNSRIISCSLSADTFLVFIMKIKSVLKKESFASSFPVHILSFPPPFTLPPSLLSSVVIDLSPMASSSIWLWNLEVMNFPGAPCSSTE